jgi:phospholipid/cholesterol/gamma-HCH transport system ATP-binding protein
VTMAIRFIDVHRRFEGRPVLRGVSAEFAASGLTAVVGRSGAGKSVLCRLAVGLLAPDRGEIEVFGQPLFGLSLAGRRAVRRTVPYVVQSPALLDWLTVEENVALAAQDRASPQIRQALAQVGLEGVGGLLPARLGPGAKKRAAFARALVRDPAFLVVDEPTTGLDRESSTQVTHSLRALVEDGIGALVVTHDLSLIRLAASRVLMLDAGEVVFHGSAATFLADDSPYARRLSSVGTEVGRDG